MSGTRAAAQKAGTRPERHEPSITPFQPTGPYPQVMLDLPTGNAIPVSDAAAGDRIVIDGTLVDGAGKPVADAMVETWQADAAGRYRHPQDPHAAHADPAFWGYGRVATY
jgi:protocatechuate 3,4-dioxygenase alpha subunit